MKTFLSVVAISMFIFTGIAMAGTCPSTNVIEDPASFEWTNEGGYYSGTLEIGEETFDIGGESLTTRAYRQKGKNFSIPGPTMFMTPGNTYVLTFKNTLPFEEPSPVHNDLKDPNITNIHTHGLHVSGETPADDVTRLINGGECGDYVYEIDQNHMGGSLWYHAHHHGSTWLQVAGGAFGMLIIDDSGDGIPANVADMPERQLAIGYLDPAGVAGKGGDTTISGNFTSKWTVNGNVEGNLCMPEGEWQHWRVLIADPDARMKTVTIGPECEALLMARDGVWRTVAPKVLPENTIELTGASRADLAVRCSADSTVTVDNTVVANVVADPSLPLNPGGPYDPDNTVDGTWSALRPSYLQDLRDATPDFSRKISMGARSVNGEKFDADNAAFTLDAGIHEWEIKGATNHPFHLHVYHQQMQGDCGSGGAFEDGEWYDTIAGSCLIRLDTDPETTTAYSGRTIMHCHILEHEDQGAMIWADATAGEGPPISPDPNHRDIYECGSVCIPTGQPDTNCDGVDDDCNGTPDDGYEITPTTCGVGECASNTGQLECQNGTEVDTCDPLAGATTEGPPGDGTCSDTFDNDCDGLTDADEDPDCQAGIICDDIVDRTECRSYDQCQWKKGACITR